MMGTVISFESDEQTGIADRLSRKRAGLLFMILQQQFPGIQALNILRMQRQILDFSRLPLQESRADRLYKSRHLRFLAQHHRHQESRADRP